MSKEKNKVQGATLYLVGTPIGNMADLSERAKKVLSEVDFIAAEDTRNSDKLLSLIGVQKELVSYHEHNKKSAGERLVARLMAGESFSGALTKREFEPDAPNLTPRISGMATFANGNFTYEMSILKSADAEGTACNRYTFSYPSLAGLGHFIHTYVCDGNPIPTFQGEPERVAIPDDIDVFTSKIWENLDPDNKISLYVRYIDLESGACESRMINKNKEA